MRVVQHSVWKQVFLILLILIPKISNSLERSYRMMAMKTQFLKVKKSAQQQQHNMSKEEKPRFLVRKKIKVLLELIDSIHFR
jgi:hypothetical protein